MSTQEATLQPPNTVAELIDQVREGRYGPRPEEVHVTSAIWIRQSTQFAGTQQKYTYHYLLTRVGQGFGACGFEPEQVESTLATEAAGQTLDRLLNDARLPVQIAALDAYFAEVLPHWEAPLAYPVDIPAGKPIDKARKRDATIVSLLEIKPGQRIGLIGVVNPLVQAIQERGATCLPCDFHVRTTQWGDPVTPDMENILGVADAIIATGMTLSNGAFDRVLACARERALPLVIYAQTGSAVAPRFLGNGVSAVSAEPFPFSHFNGGATTLYCYRAG